MKQTLKRCPFCGATAHIYRCFHEELYFAACTFCGNFTQFYRNPNFARDAWNKRYTIK